MLQKGILTRIGETIDGWRSEQQTTPESQSVSDMSRSHRWFRWFLPTPGNVLFTLLVIGSLLWAQNVGAVSLGAPAVNSSLTIPYQGRLANASGTPFTGNQNMEFRLYNAPSGGTPLWSELWTGGNSVTVNDGLFSVLLGSLQSGLPGVVQSNGQLWLGITVGTDGEMSPRVQLGSAAYSMQALTVPDGSITKAKLGADVNFTPPDGSITTAKLADGSVTGAKIADGSINSADIADGSVTGVDLANNAVTAAKIADGSVSKAKLGSDVSQSLTKKQFVQGGSIHANVQNAGWNLHQGTGERSYIEHVNFDQSFVNTPKVLANLYNLDAASNTNVRVEVSVTNITTSGFDMKFLTWSDTVIYGAGGTWMAWSSE